MTTVLLPKKLYNAAGAVTLTGDATGTGTGTVVTTIATSNITGRKLTGFTSGAGTVDANDTILQAIEKLDGNIAALTSVVGGHTTSINTIGGKYVRQTRFAEIGAGTSGTVTVPTNCTVILDDFGGTVDAVVTKMSGGKPVFESAVTAGAAVISTTFDASGNYTLSDTPSAYPVAIVYRTRCNLVNLDNALTDVIGEYDIP